MLGQAQAVQPGPAGLTEQPVGVGGGKRQLFGQLAVGVEIKQQQKHFLFSKRRIGRSRKAHSRVETNTVRQTHKAEMARNSQSS